MHGAEKGIETRDFSVCCGYDTDPPPLSGSFCKSTSSRVDSLRPIIDSSRLKIKPCKNVCASAAACTTQQLREVSAFPKSWISCLVEAKNTAMLSLLGHGYLGYGQTAGLDLPRALR
jgi:hypothetical protein